MRKTALLLSLAAAFVFLAMLLPILDMASVEAREVAKIPSIQSAYAKIEKATDLELSFSLYIPPASISASGLVEVNGLSTRTQKAGMPDLPYYSTWVAVPPEVEVSVHVETETTTKKEVPLPITFTPESELAYRNDDENPLFPATPNPHAIISNEYEIYDSDQWFPTAVYEVSAPFYYRDLRLVEVKLFPVRYHGEIKQLEEVTEMRISVIFSGERVDELRPLSGNMDATYQALRDRIINFEQGMAWRHLPQALQDLPGPALPLGVDTYKIFVDTDGVYEISGQELADSGMDLNQVDPSTIEMMHRGQPVAYQFIGNPADGFQPTDAIRFFGSAFTGSRLETQFVSDNVYWLWAGGSPSYISERENNAGQGQPVLTTFRSTITREPENIHHSTWTNQWHTFPNEPDAWYWELILQNASILTRTYAITLPHPALTGSDPYYEVELLSRETNTSPTNFTYDVRATINNYPEQGRVTWQRLRNVNLTGTQPINTLLPGVNQVSLIFATSGGVNPQVYLNRISVSYDRFLSADGNSLIFSKQNSPGVQQFVVNNFSESDPTHVLVWEVTDPLQPQQILMTADHIFGSGPYTYTFTSEVGASGRFIATTSANIRTVKAIDQYVPLSLDPPEGADWLAISHHLFITEAQRLADHRADVQFGGLTTHVVDIADVINQFGYGLPLPEGVRHFLGYALANWPKAPSYAVLVGGGTINPRNLSCFPNPLCRPQWDSSQPNFILTDIVFKDRFQGAVPSDFTFTTLVGDDLIPDLAIGRLVVNTIGEASNIISKIIQYDQNQLDPTDPQRHFLFVADDADIAGNFCLENSNVSNNLPTSIWKSHVCLQVPTVTDTNRIRSEMRNHIDTTGINTLIYRGHGGVQVWASPPIFNVNPQSTPGSYAYQVYITSTTPISGFWANRTHPIIIISADCLDGHFGFPGEPAVSRTFMAMPEVGSVAHWSSTGLGFTFEHTVLVNALYAGAFNHGFTALGDAINFAKFVYHSGGLHPSELYSFLLQGDPAMQLYRPDLSLEKSSPQSDKPLYPGDEATFRLEIHNNGIYASQMVLTDTLPNGLIYQGYESSHPVSLSVDGPNLIFNLDAPLAWGESASITLTTIVTRGVDGLVTNYAIGQSAGWDLNPADNEASAAVIIRDTDVRLLKSSPQSDTALYPGDEAIFYLQIDNLGLSENEITLVDFLPPELAYQNFGASVPVSMTMIGNELHFTLTNPLMPGESANLVITTTVAVDAAGLIPNTALAQGAGGDQDEASTAIFVYYLNLWLEKSSPHSNEPLFAGDLAIFNLLVRNEGINQADSIYLTDTLPLGLQYLSFSSSDPVTLTVHGNELRFDLINSIAPGGIANVVITTTVMDSAQGLLTNTASIFSPDWELNPANRLAAATVSVERRIFWSFLPAILRP